jgi:hypothetical protein
MKFRQIAVMAVLVTLLGACSRERRDMVTSSYGDQLLMGEVVMAGTGDPSPAGVRVSVRGTGMMTTLGDDGQFSFAGVPQNALLDFVRESDGVQASLELEVARGSVTIELAQSSATRRSRRRTVGPTRERTYEFEGVIRTATPESIVVFTSKQEEVTIALTEDTLIRHGNRMLTAADLLADTRVHVKAKMVDNAYSAISVWVQNQDDGDDDDGDDDGETPAVVREYEGLVVTASATELVVDTSRGEQVTFLLTATTDIRKGNTPVAPETILPGTRVHVKATEGADGAKTATRVIVQNTHIEVELEGTVASLDTASLVVTTASGDQTVNVERSTQIRKNGKKITLAEVAVGDTVEVGGTRVDATTVSAKKITVQ